MKKCYLIVLTLSLSKTCGANDKIHSIGLALLAQKDPLPWNSTSELPRTNITRRPITRSFSEKYLETPDFKKAIEGRPNYLNRSFTKSYSDITASSSFTRSSQEISSTSLTSSSKSAAIIPCTVQVMGNRPNECIFALPNGTFEHKIIAPDGIITLTNQPVAILHKTRAGLRMFIPQCTLHECHAYRAYCDLTNGPLRSYDKDLPPYIKNINNKKIPTSNCNALHYSIVAKTNTDYQRHINLFLKNHGLSITYNDFFKEPLFQPISTSPSSEESVSSEITSNPTSDSPSTDSPISVPEIQQTISSTLWSPLYLNVVTKHGNLISLLVPKAKKYTHTPSSITTPYECDLFIQQTESIFRFMFNNCNNKNHLAHNFFWDGKDGTLHISPNIDDTKRCSCLYMSYNRKNLIDEISQNKVPNDLFKRLHQNFKTATALKSLLQFHHEHVSSKE